MKITTAGSIYVTVAAAKALADEIGAGINGGVSAAKLITENGERYPIPPRIA